MRVIFKLYFLTILTAFSFSQIEDGCDLPDLNLYLTSDGSVLYNSSSDIGGFQFNVDGATVSGGSGGDSASAGFVVSAGGSTALGFSFTGASIPAGCGVLVDLDLDGDATSLSGIVMSDANAVALEFSYYEGGDNGGGGGDVTDGCDLPDLSLHLTPEGDVLYNSSADIAGIQFNVDGASVVAVGGGDAAAAGFTLSAGGTTVLGFSFTGSTIPAGCGTLLELDLAGNASGLSDIIMAGLGGDALDFSYYEGGGGTVDTCEDESACNTGSVGDCEYAEENYDCAGNCIINIDCNGDCGGSAELDECGVCEGDSSSCTGCPDLDACNYNPDATIYDWDSCIYGEEDCLGECGGLDTSCWNIEEDLVGSWIFVENIKMISTVLAENGIQSRELYGEIPTGNDETDEQALVYVDKGGLRRIHAD